MDEQPPLAICDTSIRDADPAIPADHGALSPDWACFWVNRADGLNQRGLLAHKPPSDAAKQNSIKPAPVSFRFVWYSGRVG